MVMMPREVVGRFLCMQIGEELCCLDICELLAAGRSSSPRPEFKVVKDYCFQDQGRTRLPKRMGYTALNDNLYMLGGQWLREDDGWNGISGLANVDKQWGNLCIFSCKLDVINDVVDDDPKAKGEGESPLPTPILVCKICDIPRMFGQKVNPIVVTRKDKIYVLARTFSGIVKEGWPPLFEVFNPADGSWKVLPNLPCIDGLLNATYIFQHFTWGNKLVVRSFSRSLHIFDLDEEKWEDAKDILDYTVSGFAQYEDFLVAKPTSRLELVAYQLDENGIPREDRVLNELEFVFYPPFYDIKNSSLVTLRDDLLCLTYWGMGASYNLDGTDCTPSWSVCVALFRVSISEVSGNRVLFANPEAVETYQFKHFFNPPVCSPVIMSGDLIKHATDAGVSLKNSNVSQLDRGIPTLPEIKSVPVLNLSDKTILSSRRFSIPAEPVSSYMTDKEMNHEEMNIDGRASDYIRKGEISNVTPQDNWVLHIHRDGELSSLDLSMLLAGSSSRTEFKVVHDYHLPNGRLPHGMGYMVVGSNLYLVGGKRVDKCRSFFDDMEKNSKAEEWANLTVYACEVTDDDPKGKCASIRVSKSPISSLYGPKIDPVVVPLDGKIYVLSRKHYGVVEEKWPALFEVFDPRSGTWEILSNPPFACGYVGRTFIHHHFAWGTKLVVFSWHKKMYTFDTRERKWEFAKHIVDCDVSTFAQFNEFIIAVPTRCQELVAYKLDHNGIPKLDRVLGELWQIFDPPLEVICSTNFVSNFGDGGHMCLLYSGTDVTNQWCTRVAVFRLSILDHPGDRYLHAEFINKEDYYFGDVDHQHFCSAVVM